MCPLEVFQEKGIGNILPRLVCDGVNLKIIVNKNPKRFTYGIYTSVFCFDSRGLQHYTDSLTTKLG